VLSCPARSLNLVVRRHELYSHRQAAWRSAWAVGGALFPLILLQSYLSLGANVASLFLPIPVSAAICAMLAPVFALAFGLGFRLSGPKLVDLRTVVITAAIYLILLLLLSFVASIPLETHAVIFDMPSTPGQSMHVLLVSVLLPVSAVVFAIFALPLIVAVSVARTRRGGASVA
jgi:hypothetical protein